MWDAGRGGEDGQAKIYISFCVCGRGGGWGRGLGATYLLPPNNAHSCLHFLGSTIKNVRIWEAK